MNHWFKSKKSIFVDGKEILHSLFDKLQNPESLASQLKNWKLWPWQTPSLFRVYFPGFLGTCDFFRSTKICSRRRKKHLDFSLNLNTTEAQYLKLKDKVRLLGSKSGDFFEIFDKMSFYVKFWCGLSGTNHFDSRGPDLVQICCLTVWFSVIAIARLDWIPVQSSNHDHRKSHR